MNISQKYLHILGVGFVLLSSESGYTAQEKLQEDLDPFLSGFYLGVETGMVGMNIKTAIDNTVGNVTGSSQGKMRGLSVPVQFSAGYEKTFEDAYVFGMEATYTGGPLKDRVEASFDDGAGGDFEITNSLRIKDTLGLNISFGKKLDSGLTPYLKLGLASTQFISRSSSSKTGGAAMNPWDVTQKKRVFGMTAGFGARYSISHRVDFVAETLWTFYKSFTTENFSERTADNHSFKLNPLIYLFLIGIRVKL